MADVNCELMDAGRTDGQRMEAGVTNKCLMSFI